MQPPHAPTLRQLLAELQDALERDRQFTECAEKRRLALQQLIAELQDRIDRDRQFIEQGEKIRRIWKDAAHQMEERVRKLLAAETQPGSETPRYMGKPGESG
jgi:hypothetical protein